MTDGRRFVVTTVEVEGRIEQKVVERPAFDLAPWGDDATLAHVGQPVRRLDAPQKAQGRARYTTDQRPAGLLHAAILRAEVPRGRLVSLDVAAARAVPGVRDVLVREDVVATKLAGGAARLLDPEIAYVGQPIAAVCAETRDAAAQALRALAPVVEPLPFAVTAHDALAAGAPNVRGAGGNAAFGGTKEKLRGDVDAALASAAISVTLTVTTPAALHSAMEPHGAVAEWHGDQLTVHEGTQGIFRVRDNLAKAFRLPLAQVRVLSEHMGGGFGAKNYAGAHSYLAALFARRLGAPVACILDRHGEQTDTGHRAATEQTVTLGADADGRLVAIAMDTVVATGVGGWAAAPGAIAHVLYACPNVRTRDTFAFTNVGAMDSFRAPGYVEGAFGLERAMDALARRLGLDPLELRRRNYAPHDPSQDRPWSGNALLRCYDEAAAHFGWAARRAELAVERARAPRAPVRRGVGCAAEVWSTGGGPPAYAHVRLNPDGSADVLVGTQDLGTGVRTLCAQVAAEALGYPLARVHVTVGDTSAAPYTGNSWGSITTPSVMPAVRMAAEDARRQLCEAAAELLGDVAADALVVRDGAVHDAAGTRRITAAEIGAKLGQVTILGRGTRGPNPERTGIASFGVQLVEVAVDTETGVVRVERIVAAHDAGRVVNPLLARSQLEGGILQGLGYALFEERVVDRALGIPLNTGLHDYKVPVMADTPAIDAWCVGGADTAANHVGARGLAEAPIIPIAPAIANAVADALGLEPDALPLTPWRVLGWLGADA